VKTDSERGEWGAWAYRTRDRLDLSLEQVAADLGYSDGAMRKTEAGSPGYRPPSRPLRRVLPDYYLRRASEKGIAIDPPPPSEMAGEGSARDPGLAAAIREQAAAIDRLAAVLEQDRTEGPPWVEALVRVLGASLQAPRSEASGERSASGAPQRDRV